MLLLVGKLSITSRARAERVVALGEAIDESRPALEELRELLGGSAAAVARAREGRDEQGHVIVAALQLELELDAPEERRGRMEDEPVAAGLE